MPLAIYRRHSPSCKFYGRARHDARSQKCPCGIWVQGSLGREYLRRSLDLTSWQAALDLVRGWEASGQVGVAPAEIPQIPDAIERFFDDIQARGLSTATIGKQNYTITCAPRGDPVPVPPGESHTVAFSATFGSTR